MITIGFASRTRVCIHTKFTPPIADDERRETLIHIALMTSRTFAALPPSAQSTLAGMLKEWIEDQFVACPTRLIPGDPMACLPRFASTFVAPVREYALASKGCDQNDGLEFFLPMALVSFLRYVVATYPHAEDLLKPALALCGAVMVQPLTSETHFQAAAASLPKVGPVVEKTVPEQPVLAEAISPRPPFTAKPRAEPRLPVRMGRRRRNQKRVTLILSACLAALLIIQGVQYLSTRQPELLPPPAQESLPSRPPETAPPPQAPPLPQPGVESRPGGGLGEEPPKVVIPPEAPPLAEAVSPPLLSQKIRAYQQGVRDLTEDATAHAGVMIGAIEGQILTNFELNEVLAYGLRQVRLRIRRLERMDVPEGYQERQTELIQILSELESLALKLTLARVQPDAAELEGRLTGIQSRLEKALHAIDNL